MLTLFQQAHVYAPEDLGVCDVLCGGGKIIEVSKERLSISAAEIVPCEGRTLIPGLIDGHAHITGGGGEAGFSTRVPAPFLSDFTAAGVTTVVGVLGTDDTTRDTRSLVASAYALREEGMGAFCHTGGYHIPPTTLTGSVRDDIVFIDPVIGIGEIAVSDHRSSQPTLQEILRLAADAHVAGLITGKAGILHLHMGDGTRGLDLVRAAINESELPARVFNPTHVNRNPELLVESIELAKRGSFVDATAFPIEEDDLAIDAAAAYQQYLSAGGPAERFTFSSDGGGCLPAFDETGTMTRMDVGRANELTRTLMQLLQTGMPIPVALAPFTINPATLLRLRDRGRVAANLCADLLMLDDSQSITDVMINGAWHMQNSRIIRRGHFESE